MKKQDHSKLFVEAMVIKNLPYLKQEKSQKIMTLMMTLFLLTVFGYFAIAPTLATIAQLNKQIDDSKHVSESFQTKIQNLNTLHDKYAALEPILPIIINAIPQDPRSTYLVGQIQQVAQNTGVTINSIDILQVDLQNQSPQSTNSSFAFSVDVSGSLDSLHNFLQSLATMDRIVTFESLTYTSKDNQTAAFELSMRGKAYIKK